MTLPTIKTRFAPSPTGYMHLGNFRTALFAYLFAKKNKGNFILRIEDTDKTRQVDDAEQSIFRVLKWAGLAHDEGPDIGGPNGPYRQSERLYIYQSHIKQLLENNHAYHCFCTTQRLEKMRQQQQSQGMPPRYDRHCLSLSSDEVKQKIDNGDPYVIRQKTNISGETKFNDLVRGEIIIQNKILDDSILIKSDGYPTYNFANVIDDHLMGVTHIIRGEEYLNSTPKYIQLYQAFNWDIPTHAHLSLILNTQRAKLSKRDGHVSVEDYIAQGYLPQAIINFIALLGWNPKDERELFTLDELIKEFSFANVNKAGAIFDQTKLDWMNSHYIKQTDLDELTHLAMPYIKQSVNYDYAYIKSIVELEQPRLNNLSQIGELISYFFTQPNYNADLLIWKKTDRSLIKERLTFVIQFIQEVPQKNWTRSTLEDSLINHIKQHKFGNGEVLWPMRVALSGKEKSPSPFEIAEILGQQETIKRLKIAQDKLK